MNSISWSVRAEDWQPRQLALGPARPRHNLMHLQQQPILNFYNRFGKIVFLLLWLGKHIKCNRNGKWELYYELILNTIKVQYPIYHSLTVNYWISRRKHRGIMYSLQTKCQETCLQKPNCIHRVSLSLTLYSSLDKDRQARPGEGRAQPRRGPDTRDARSELGGPGRCGARRGRGHSNKSRGRGHAAQATQAGVAARRPALPGSPRTGSATLPFFLRILTECQ